VAVDASGNLTADRDARSTDFTGLLRDRIRKRGKSAGQTDAQILAATCDALRRHAVESVVKGGYAVPLPSAQAIRRETWEEAWDSGWDAAVAAASELTNDAGSATS
jgi:hypothetical protein